MARTRKKLTDEELERRRKSQERIAAYLAEKGISRQGLANRVSCSEGTIRNYLTGRSYMTGQMALLFEQKTGIIGEYWLGWVDYKTPQEREEERKNIIYDSSEWNAVDSVLVEQHRIDAQNAAFFARFGFSYENLTATPGALEFAGLDDQAKAVKSFRLASLTDQGLSASFTESELQAVFDRLHDTLHGMIELECYRKAAAQDK